MAVTHTFCRICEAGCGLTVTTEGEQVVRIEPDGDHVSSQGFACVKGVRFGELHHSPDRLDHPMKRVGDRWEAISWDQAIAEIAAKVNEIRARHGDDAIGGYLGNPSAFGALHAMAFHGFLLGLGTTNAYSSASQDLTNKYLVAQRMYGVPLLQPIPDLDRSGFVMLLGTNPAISQMSVVQAPKAMSRLKAVVERGGRVIHVNPRRTETARAVGEQVFIRPGTDVFFLASFLREVLADDQLDRDLIATHTTGFGALAAVVEPWSPERTAPVTGVEPEVLRDLVAAHGQASAPGSPGAVLYASTGVNMGPHGTLAYWLVNVINTISGNLDRAGGAVVPTPRLDFPKMMRQTGMGTHQGRSRIGGFEMIIDTYPTSILPDEILTPGPGQVRALFVSAGNPALSAPNGPRMEEALADLELLVCVDMFRNETGNHAHYLLPAQSWLERPDIPYVHAFAGLQLDPWMQYTPAVVPPVADRKEESWIYRRLAAACGVPMMGSKLQGLPFAASDVLSKIPKVGSKLELDDARILTALLAAARLDPRKVKRAVHGVRTSEGPPGGEFLGRRVMTDDGKVHLAPPDFLAHARTLELDERAELAAPGQLRLITRRERHSHNSWTHNAEAFVGGSRSTNRCFVHPDDAARAGLAEGDVAEIRSATGKIRLPVVLDEDLMVGVIAVPHGWGHARADGLAVAQAAAGENANALSPDGPEACEALSGMARLTAIPVELERA
jgi:anaerobic selenocysteine-containing dehydrogenase